MIKLYNESDYNLQLRFLVSLGSSEGDRKNTMSFYFHFYLFFLPETKAFVTLYNDKSYYWNYYIFLGVSQGTLD